MYLMTQNSTDKFVLLRQVLYLQIVLVHIHTVHHGLY